MVDPARSPAEGPSAVEARLDTLEAALTELRDELARLRPDRPAGPEAPSQSPLGVVEAQMRILSDAATIRSAGADTDPYGAPRPTTPPGEASPDVLSALEAAAVEALLTEAPVEVDVDRASARTIVRVVFAALDVEGRLARIAQLERLVAVLHDAASAPVPQALSPGWPTSAGAGSPVTAGDLGRVPDDEPDDGLDDEFDDEDVLEG